MPQEAFSEILRELRYLVLVLHGLPDMEFRNACIFAITLGAMWLLIYEVVARFGRFSLPLFESARRHLLGQLIMPTVQFTANLTRQTNAPTCKVNGSTAREALDAVFAMHPTLRSYILDDQHEVRRHVVVFVDGTAVKDRLGLSDAVSPDSEIFVMQALSGG